MFLREFIDIDAVVGRVRAADRVTEDQLRAGDAGDDHDLAGSGPIIRCWRSARVVCQAVAVEAQFLSIFH
jgi:hypothetical protein